MEMNINSQIQELDADTRQVPVKAIRRIRGSALLSGFPEEEDQSVRQISASKASPASPTHQDSLCAELPEYPLDDSDQQTQQDMAPKKLIKKRQPQPAKSRASGIKRLRESLYWTAPEPSQGLREKISAPSNLVHVTKGTPEAAQMLLSLHRSSQREAQPTAAPLHPETALHSYPPHKVPIIILPTTRVEKKLPPDISESQIQPSPGRLTSDAAWKISFDEEHKRVGKLEEMMADPLREIKILQREIKILKNQFDLSESICREQEATIEKIRLELMIGKETALVAENQVSFQRKSNEHLEREVRRLQKRLAEYSEPQESGGSHTAEDLLRSKNEGRVHEHSASISYQVLAPNAAPRSSLNVQAHELSATISHQVFHPAQNESSLAATAQAFSGYVPYRAPELEILREGFTDLFTTQAQEQRPRSEGIPDSPTLPATNTLPIQASLSSLQQNPVSSDTPKISTGQVFEVAHASPDSSLPPISPEYDVSLISRHDPSVTPTAFQFNVHRIERVPAVFRIPLEQAESLQDPASTRDSANLLPALDGWEWSSVPDLKLGGSSLDE